MSNKSSYVSIMMAAVTLLSGCAREAPAPIAPAKPPPPAYDSLPRLYVAYPEKPDPNCRDGNAKLYDECGDQIELFERARAHARSEGKTLLVEYGAEWCIWCQVFAAHIKGEHSHFRYTYADAESPDDRDTSTFTEGRWADTKAAKELADYVARNFVLVYIDLQHAPNGDAVIESAGAWDHYTKSIPYIFSVDRTGRFAVKFESEPAVRRRDGLLDWYRGYDRTNVLAQLKAMREADLVDQQ